MFENRNEIQINENTGNGKEWALLQKLLNSLRASKDYFLSGGAYIIDEIYIALCMKNGSSQVIEEQYNAVLNALEERVKNSEEEISLTNISTEYTSTENLSIGDIKIFEVEECERKARESEERTKDLERFLEEIAKQRNEWDEFLRTNRAEIDGWKKEENVDNKKSLKKEAPKDVISESSDLNSENSDKKDKEIMRLKEEIKGLKKKLEEKEEENKKKLEEKEEENKELKEKLRIMEDKYANLEDKFNKQSILLQNLANTIVAQANRITEQAKIITDLTNRLTVLEKDNKDLQAWKEHKESLTFVGRCLNN